MAEQTSRISAVPVLSVKLDLGFCCIGIECVELLAGSDEGSAEADEGSKEADEGSAGCSGRAMSRVAIRFSPSAALICRGMKGTRDITFRVCRGVSRSAGRRGHSSKVGIREILESTREVAHLIFLFHTVARGKCFNES